MGVRDDRLVRELIETADGNPVPLLTSVVVDSVDGGWKTPGWMTPPRALPFLAKLENVPRDLDPVHPPYWLAVAAVDVDADEKLSCRRPYANEAPEEDDDDSMGNVPTPSP